MRWGSSLFVSLAFCPHAHSITSPTPRFLPHELTRFKTVGFLVALCNSGNFPGPLLATCASARLAAWLLHPPRSTDVYTLVLPCPGLVRQKNNEQESSSISELQGEMLLLGQAFAAAQSDAHLAEKPFTAVRCLL